MSHVEGMYPVNQQESDGVRRSTFQGMSDKFYPYRTRLTCDQQTLALENPLQYLRHPKARFAAGDATADPYCAQADIFWETIAGFLDKGKGFSNLFSVIPNVTLYIADPYNRASQNTILIPDRHRVLIKHGHIPTIETKSYWTGLCYVAQRLLLTSILYNDRTSGDFALIARPLQLGSSAPNAQHIASVLKSCFAA